MSAGVPFRPPQPARLVVLISGNGTNLQAVIDACVIGNLNARVEAVFSDRTEAYGLRRANLAGITGFYIPKNKEDSRQIYDANLAERVATFKPDWVLLLGWMRILSYAFLNRFSGRVINLHPALPGMFPGTHAIERAYKAYQNREIQHTGVMIHLVPDERVDAGPVLGQELVPILADDSLEKLEERVHQAEHHLLLSVLEKCLSGDR